MAHTKSARKRIRQTETRNDRNRSNRSRLKTVCKDVEKALQAAVPATAATEYQEAQILLDRSAAKGLIPKNRASRKKSRLMKRLNALEKK